MYPLRKGSPIRLHSLFLGATETWKPLSYAGEMSEAFSTTAGLKEFPLFLSYQRVGKFRGPVAFFLPLLWGCLVCKAPHFWVLSFGTRIVYMLALLSHNILQYLRDAGDPKFTLRFI